MPSYLSLFDGNSRLRSCHLDRLSFVSSIVPSGQSTSTLNKSFFYRSHNLWNSLPLEIREISNSSEFKNNVRHYFWKIVANELETDLESMNESIDDSIT